MPDSSPTPLRTTGKLVGRQRELELIDSLLRRASAGEATVVLLSGEPGIGKTRILDEAAARLQRQGCTVIRGTAFEAEGMPPFLPFLQALRTYIAEAPPEALRAAAGLETPILASILPELVRRIGEAEPGPALPPEQARFRLFEAVAEFLCAIAEAKPLALIFDNLDSADASSHELLVHVVRNRPQGRLLILGAYRDVQTAPEPTLDRTTTELARLRRLHHVRLPALTAREIHELAAAYLDGPVAGDLGERLHSQSEGNPFFAEELLRDWIEAGVLQQAASPLGESRPTWRLSGTLPSAMPASIAAAVRQRISRLPPLAVDVLRIGSVIGHAFEVGLLARLAEQDEVAVGELLLHAERAGLLTSASTGRITFTHEKVRESLYAEVSSARRRHLHTQIGLALEEDPDRVESGRIAELAYHFSRSSDPGRGLRYSRQAAEAARQAHAAEEALIHLRRARELLSEDDDGFGDLLLELGRAALAAGSPVRAEEAYRTALEWFRSRGRASSVSRAGHGLAKARWQMDDLVGAESAFRQALRTAGEPPLSVREAVELHVDTAQFLGVTLGRVKEAIDLARRGLALAEDSRAPGLEAPAGRILGFLTVLDGDLEAGRGLLEHAFSLAEAADDPVEAAACCAALAQTHVWRGDFQQSKDVSLRREALARTSRQLEELSYVYSWLTFLAAASGDWTEASRWLEPAQVAVDRLPSVRPAAFLSQVRGFLAFQSQDLAEAEAHFQSALTVFRSTDPMEYVLCIGMLGLVQAHRSEGHAAREAMGKQENLLAHGSLGNLPAASIRSSLMLTRLRLGQVEGLRELYGALYASRGQHHWFLVDRALGESALSFADPETALGHLDSARGLAERERLLPELARTHLALADAEIARADSARSAARAREHLRLAQEIYDLLDCTPGVQEAQERLAAVPSQPATSRRGLHPAGLSEREAQVLRLVAAGKTNRDVAVALALSESTVAKHLTSIYTKIGVDNRAAATAFAIRNGLA